MGRSQKKDLPERSLSSFVEGVAHLLRSEVSSLKDKKVSQLKTQGGSAHKIELIAALLRKKAHESRSKKSKRRASSPKRPVKPAPRRKAPAR
ncbi:MAG: hypothetical protein HYX48_07065 [Chlamydiales bacterium]|nr:hypothetical protein [Chlamydiales bacterium]